MEQCRLPAAPMKESKRAVEGFDSLELPTQNIHVIID